MSPYLRSSSAQLLAFPREDPGDDGLEKSHFARPKHFLSTADLLSGNDEVLL